MWDGVYRCTQGIATGEGREKKRGTPLYCSPRREEQTLIDIWLVRHR